jgi:hypothetical protein
MSRRHKQLHVEESETKNNDFTTALKPKKDGHANDGKHADQNSRSPWKPEKRTSRMRCWPKKVSPRIREPRKNVGRENHLSTRTKKTNNDCDFAPAR